MRNALAIVDNLDLLAEHDQGRSLHQKAIDFFTSNGVNALALVKTPFGDYDLVLLDDIVWLPHGTFEFARYHKHAENADAACTFVVRDYLGDPLDIIAWSAKSDRVGRWLGRAALVGEDMLLAPRVAEGLAVFETLIDWFKHGREGVVVLDKARAAPKLRDAAPLLAKNLEHGEKLRDMLRVTPPRILVPSSVSQAEAA